MKDKKQLTDEQWKRGLTPEEAEAEMARISKLLDESPTTIHETISVDPQPEPQPLEEAIAQAKIDKVLGGK